MAVRTIRRQVRVTPEQRAFLDKLVAERGITISAWFREQIAEERERVARETQSAGALDEPERGDSQ